MHDHERMNYGEITRNNGFLVAMVQLVVVLHIMHFVA